MTVVAAPEAAPPPPRDRTAHQPRETMPLGDRPRRHRGRRAARVLAALSGLAVAVFAIVQIAGAGGGLDPSARPGAPVSGDEVERLVSAFGDAYAKEDSAALGRLLTRDAERVVPGARQAGRSEVLQAYRRQFADSDTRSFEVRDLETTGGATGRASGRYVATYAGAPDVTGTIALGVLRDRGEPRIALISARQDPPAG